MEILEEAFLQTQRDPDVFAGSATATIVSLDSKTGKLSAANLGDSTFFVIRDGKLIFVAPPQTYYFNCPRQLAKMPKRWREPGSIDDRPSDADIINDMALQENDVVVLATDGVIDNLFFDQIEKVYATTLGASASLQDFAHSSVYSSCITLI